MARLVQYDKNGNVILNRYNLIGSWNQRMRIAPDGKWMRYEDVASFISEAGRTVRRKPPVQQRKAKMPRNCGTCQYIHDECPVNKQRMLPGSCSNHDYKYWKRGTSAVA